MVGVRVRVGVRVVVVVCAYVWGLQGHGVKFLGSCDGEHADGDV